MTIETNNRGDAGVPAPASSRRYEPLVVAPMADGTQLMLPVHRITGAKSGPTIGLTAVIHGDEPLPNEIVRRALLEIEARVHELAGTVLAIPTTYPQSFEAMTRNSPLDMLDLNRSFPGDAGGWLTEQIAHVLARDFVPRLDVLVDFHSGGTHPTVDYVYALEGALDLATAYGAELLFLARSPHPGSMGAHAQSLGIPAMMVEVGGGQQLEESFIAGGIAGIVNVLKHYKLLPGEPAPPARQLLFDEMAWIRPRAGGILHPQLPIERLRTEIAGGELLGVVRSPLTFEPLEELRSPFEHGVVVLLRSTFSRVNPGDFAYMIGNAAAVVTA